MDALWCTKFISLKQWLYGLYQGTSYNQKANHYSQVALLMLANLQLPDLLVLYAVESFFAGCCIDSTLQHLKFPARALAEASMQRHAELKKIGYSADYVAKDFQRIMPDEVAFEVLQESRFPVSFCSYPPIRTITLNFPRWSECLQSFQSKIAHIERAMLDIALRHTGKSQQSGGNAASGAAAHSGPVPLCAACSERSAKPGLFHGDGEPATILHLSSPSRSRKSLQSSHPVVVPLSEDGKLALSLPAATTHADTLLDHALIHYGAQRWFEEFGSQELAWSAANFSMLPPSLQRFACKQMSYISLDHGICEYQYQMLGWGFFVLACVKVAITIFIVALTSRAEENPFDWWPGFTVCCLLIIMICRLAISTSEPPATRIVVLLTMASALFSLYLSSGVYPYADI